MASLLMGMHPPRIRGAALVRWCALFGIAEGTARVALSRMTARRELVAVDGVYELSGALAARQREQEWALRPHALAWGGAWRVGVVEGSARPAGDRQALRDAMRHLRFAELRPGVWTRPDNLPEGARPAGARRVADAQCGWWQARPEPDPRELVETLFDPAGWAREADELIAGLERTAARLGDGDDGLVADAFVVGATALVHVRSDPLLPAELLPDAWPGARLRDAYRDYRAAFAGAAAAWFRRNR
jgi:phenylacetic acid degradation operon negative regulatory protein